MIESLLIHKQDVVCVPETWNCADALELLEQHQVRCAPIVDSTNTLYRGNVYRYHIYQYAYNNPQSDLRSIPVTHFLKNSTRFARLSDSLFNLIFAMNDLPYLAILNEHNAFVGIIRHNRLLNFLSQAWVMHDAGYVLQVEAIGAKGELAKITKIINKYCDISTVMTLEQSNYGTSTYVLFVLPSYLDLAQFNHLLRDLARKHYRVVHFNMR